MKLCNNISNLRECNNLSLEEFSSRLHVSKEVISDWEINRKEPSIDELKLISNEFNISIDELVGNNKYVKNDRKVFYVGYEYKSKRNIRGIPLLHINIGRGKKARGIISIGNNSKGILSIGGRATGIISLGGISLGLISIGGIGFGLFTCAGIALALLISVGGISVAPFAIGGIALGILTLGGISIGYYSIGGYSIGKYISIGGYANGDIAIGHFAKGNIIPKNFTSKEIRKLILDNYPNTWKFIIDFVCSFFR